MALPEVIPPLVGKSQASLRIGVSRHTVTRWIENGRMTPATTVDGAPVFTIDYVERMAAAYRLLAGDHR